MKVLLIFCLLLIIIFSVFFTLEDNDIISEDIMIENYTLNDARELSKFEQHKVFPEVWSQNSPYGASYEFKVNCFGDYDLLETCFLWDLDDVNVISPNGSVFELEKDFNINNYSGEVTRRWVLYGPYNGSLPLSGNYTFQFIKNRIVMFEDTIEYRKSIFGYPKNVNWERRNDDLYVSWSPLTGMTEDMFYKVIIWEEYGTPDTFVSDRFYWNVTDAILNNVPLIDGGNYSVNVAVYFKYGYSFSEYIKFEW